MKKSVKKHRGKFNVKKTPLYKLLKICVVILCVLILIWVGLKISEKEEEKELRGELGSIGIFGADEETGVYFLEACNIENFTRSWESVFKEDSSGIVPVYNSKCTSYMLYKTNGNIIYILSGGVIDESFSLTHFLNGIYANLTTSSINYLNLIDSESIGEMTTALFFLGLQIGEGVQGYRNISNISSANDEFLNIFLIENGTWENNGLGYYLLTDEDYFSFKDRGKGAVYKNITFDFFMQDIQTIKPVNLTQIKNIENIIIYGSKTYAYTLYLEDYFENFGDENSNLSIKFNVSFGAGPIGFIRSFYYPLTVNFDTSNNLGGTFTMNMILSHPGWNNGENVTSNSFNVTIRGCLDSDGGEYAYYNKGSTQNLSENKTDSCSSNILTEYYCYNEQIKNRSYACGSGYYCGDGACVVNTSVEHPPSFNATACDDLKWEVNTNYVLDMKKCWYDEDNNDTLSGFRYTNSNIYNKNLTIIQNSTNLTLVPNTSWVGDGYFYVYASDGKNESEGRVDFEVVNSTIVNNTNLSRTNTTTLPVNPKIKNSNPSIAEVYMFPGNKTFSITAENYNTIKWYLNGGIVTEAEGKLFYDFSNLKEGDIVKVEVINGTKIDSKTWNIKIQEDESGEESVFDVGNVIFYSIIAILCIIIFLVIWLFIIEKNKGSRQTKIGFGVSSSENDVITEGRGSSLDYFNIPG